MDKMLYNLLKMNYPAASRGVSQKALNAPRGGEYNPEVI
jgi:hypothetical protein